MQTNTIKHKLKAGGCALGTCITDHTSPEIVTICKAAGLDFFFIDTEHSVPSCRDIQTLVRVGRGAGVIPLTRVTQAEYFLIARLLDVGAMGIIAPRIGSVEQARAVVDAMKFTPEGSRGYGLRGIINDYQYAGARAEMDSANRETMVVLQVESQECLDAVFDIAATPGADALMIGPFDLSISMGIPGQFDDPAFWKAIDRVVAACDKAGIAPGIHMGSSKALKKAAERGMRFLVCGSDASVLLSGYRSVVQEMALGEIVATKAGYM
ncbi:MAG TPA: aldolase/citrate lyase family protein [Bryobacterales bacterium]|nr:aldolase/citrate lyase family protein [Bryobacterales bacterium]